MSAMRFAYSVAQSFALKYEYALFVRSAIDGCCQGTTSAQDWQGHVSFFSFVSVVTSTHGAASQHRSVRMRALSLTGGTHNTTLHTSSIHTRNPRGTYPKHPKQPPCLINTPDRTSVMLRLFFAEEGLPVFSYRYLSEFWYAALNSRCGRHLFCVASPALFSCCAVPPPSDYLCR